ncbi:MAG: TrkH family potassium uptake protein [Pseudomonadales bacterium]|jgi:trk system potassium uptake protein TrkH
MHFTVILRIVGILLMIFSLTMAIPLVISWGLSETATMAFLSALTITLLTGFTLWAPVRHVRHELRTRDGFIIVALFWTVLSLFGALPFYLSDDLKLSAVDAIFESVSGLTTTGATVITGLDLLPKSILYYRQQLQWMGGMGIIVLAVAILPMLGIGGMQLYRAETPGPVKDTKLTPRITETAKALWYIYASLTVLCMLAYWAAGMTFFDALSHSFSTVAIGGFSTHDASFAYFDSALIEGIGIFFMVLSGANFGLHFVAWQSRGVRHYLADPEFRFYIYLLIVVSAVTCAVLIATDSYQPLAALRAALFEVVSIATTTGFATADFAHWPNMLPFLLFLSAFVGGCAGSTGGGMKVIRILLLSKQGIREVKRLIHPNGVFTIKFGQQAVPDKVVGAIWGFFSVYLLAFVFMLIALLATGIDQVTAWSAVGATLNNLGPGLGEVSANFSTLNDPAKCVLSLSMLLGRLEVFTFIVIFSPMFWRR